ncbi:hypothetical protein TVAG_091060 [Trichomonas vaginalis G3]|uniref:Uncharacterized protein n=1 Tax=Trichomonas vaginalis (strain ATCC PRA-98 / G3) TaxID=412133 RepID=A2F610_TRIV3|nr:armadillo (ARM) repeat-containing protein family [Trichomonas vaginalis G3]EAX99639.1 hypothetical protein TVAG_091060 [Trichomonas vaginalis G3]KAI5522436.1 armadillo (ARM) repeat-containing protein family [Trichomonas vaginalis G3]|eukprot:XP_001312569.1 hypothetical protein [Trichomonas vaginalis G3]
MIPSLSDHKGKDQENPYKLQNSNSYITRGLSKEEDIQFRTLILDFPNQFQNLQSENETSIRNALKYLVEITSFNQAHPSIKQIQLYERLLILLFHATDISIINDLTCILKAIIGMTNHDLTDELLSYLFSLLDNQQLARNGIVLEIYQNIFEILIKRISQLPDKLNLQPFYNFVGLSPNLDRSVARFICKYQKFKFDPESIDIIFAGVNIFINSPYIRDSGFYVIKIVGKTIEHFEEERKIEDYSEAILQFNNFWAFDDSDINSLLFLLMQFGLSREVLNNLLENGGYQAIYKSLDTDDSNSESGAFELLAFVLKNEDWKCPFSIDDVLSITTSRIFNGTMKIRNAAGQFLAVVAQLNPSLFVDSFMTYNENDSDENPDPKNYARCFGFLLQMSERIEKDEIYDGLAAIGKYFYNMNKLFEFKETCSGYDIDSYAESDAQEEKYEASASLFYYTYICHIFTVE